MPKFRKKPVVIEARIHDGYGVEKQMITYKCLGSP